MKKTALLGGILTFAALHSDGIQPMIIHDIVKQAQKNENWKTAVATGKYEQIVFMNVSPTTNPKNEIGLEVHPFDQVIYVIEGEGTMVLDDSSSKVKEGDVIFVPTGTSHNLINLRAHKPLKVISFYSSTDIPAQSAFPKKDSEPSE